MNFVPKLPPFTAEGVIVGFADAKEIGRDTQPACAQPKGHKVIPKPQETIYCVVNYAGELATKASSGRWSFKTLHHAIMRRDSDRKFLGTYEESNARVARYEFAGWAD